MSVPPRPRRGAAAHAKARRGPPARAGALTAVLAAALLAAPAAPAAFVVSGSILGPGTAVFAGWDAAYAVTDATDLGSQDDWRFHKVWIGLGTSMGGQAEASAENPIEHVYLRIDHKGISADAKTNWNIQLNLGSASAGHVDHLLSMRAEGPDTVLVRLSEYTQPYPLLGAFTTGSMTERASNVVGAAAFQDGVVARTGSWDGSRYGFEVSIPIAWFRDAPAGQVEGDGTGARWLTGAAFSSGGSFGAVATTRDIVQDASGEAVTIVGDTLSGATTFESAAADHLTFSVSPDTTPAGQTLSPVSVSVLDDAGNVVQGASHFVTVAIGQDPTGSATLAGTRTVQAVDGVATFADLSVDLAGSRYTLMASAGNVLDVQSDPFDVVEAVPEVTASTSPVTATGDPDPGLWGAWAAVPSATDVRSANYLKVQNTGNIDEVAFRVAFDPEGFVGADDASWSVPASAMEFRCAYTGDDASPASLFSDATAWATDAPGSRACTFPPGSAGSGTMYVQYRIASMPDVLPVQAYRASFTVQVEEPA